MWISLRDRSLLASALRAGLDAGGSPAEIVEHVAAILPQRVIEIRLPHEYIKMVSSAAARESPFSRLRNDLFHELGLRLPDFRFVEDDLQPFQFAFRVNDMTLLPWNSVSPDRRLVNAAPDLLAAYGIESVRATSPYAGDEWAAIDVAAVQKAGETGLGLLTWDTVGHLVLNLAACLRSEGWRFVNLDTVTADLDAIGSTALVDAVRTRFSNAQITQVLRRLVAEQVSIRNLRLILESLVDFGYTVAAPAEYLAADDRIAIPRAPDAAWLSDPGNLATFVRTRMKRYISQQFGNGQGTLFAWLLESDMEEALGYNGIGAANVLEAIRRQAASAPTSRSVLILTSAWIRARLQHIVAPEFPFIWVLCHEELPSDTRVHSTAQLRLLQA